MAQKLSAEQLEYRARLFRDTYGFALDQKLDTQQLLARYLAKHTELTFQVVEDWELRHAVAQTYPAGKSIKISRSIMDNFYQGDPRSELIVLEELSHYLFQHSGIRNRAKGVRDSAVLPRSPHAIEEWQAKYFAVALKSPMGEAIKCSSASEIQVKFGLSARAAGIRWEEVQREQRKISGERRPLPPEIAKVLHENGKHRAITRKNKQGCNTMPKSYQKFAVEYSAVTQGYAADKCPACQNYTLTVAGGCWTCGTCGESNCD